ncbi:dienelactone hydrolase family protein [Achromobacter xylosoxidans]|nr:dienelactone hydrolase family protein [Achromobacter xylosoxidans]
MLTKGISIRSEDGHRFGALLGHAGNTRAPVIVVAQEIFGVNAFMQDTAAWLARNGYTALCPDLYARQAEDVALDPRDEPQRQQAYALWKAFDTDSGVSDLAAAIDYARRQPYCNGKVGLLGYCLGGALAFLVAARGLADLAVGYYGVGLENRLDLVPRITRPAMCHMGGKDHFVPPDARAAITTGFAANPLLQLYWYEDAGHSFARKNSPGFLAAAAELANGRTLDFFSSLKGLG